MNGFGYTTKQGIQMTQWFLILIYFVSCMQLGAYLVLFCSAEADAAYAPLATFEPYMPFRDPTCGISTYRLTVLDCIRVRNFVLQPFFFFFHMRHHLISELTVAINGLLNTYYTSVWALQCGLGYFESAPCRLD